MYINIHTAYIYIDIHTTNNSKYFSIVIQFTLFSAQLYNISNIQYTYYYNVSWISHLYIYSYIYILIIIKNYNYTTCTVHVIGEEAVLIWKLGRSEELHLHSSQSSYQQSTPWFHFDLEEW